MALNIDIMAWVDVSGGDIGPGLGLGPVVSIPLVQNIRPVIPLCIPTAEIASNLFLVVAARKFVHAHSNTREGLIEIPDRGLMLIHLKK